MPAQHIRAKLRDARAEVEAGRAWRAKEMLQGCLATDYALEPAILEAYGKLLDSLGDRCEAGMYLFLSGQRDPAYSQAIEIFLQRYRKTAATDLIARFPARIRREGLGHLPAVVREELEARGASREVLERREPVSHGVRQPTWYDWALLGGCLLVFLLFLAVFLIGVVTIWRWYF